MDYTALNERLKDEYKDVITYVDLYKTSGEGIFRDIAREEMTHAKIIENFLKEQGQLDQDPDIRKKAEQALSEV